MSTGRPRGECRRASAATWWATLAVIHPGTQDRGRRRSRERPSAEPKPTSPPPPAPPAPPPPPPPPPPSRAARARRCAGLARTSCRDAESCRARLDVDGHVNHHCLTTRNSIPGVARRDEQPSPVVGRGGGAGPGGSGSTDGSYSRPLASATRSRVIRGTSAMVAGRAIHRPRAWAGQSRHHFVVSGRLAPAARRCRDVDLEVHAGVVLEPRTSPRSYTRWLPPSAVCIVHAADASIRVAAPVARLSERARQRLPPGR